MSLITLLLLRWSQHFAQ